LHYILKYNRFKIIDVNRKIKLKVLINEKTEKFEFDIVALARKKKRKYACFLQDDLETTMDFEMLFKTIVAKCYAGLIINPETYSLKQYRFQFKNRSKF